MDAKTVITLELSTPYYQEQNRVCERTGRTIMDITRATILEGNIDNDLLPELMLVMTHIKNSQLTRGVQDLSSHKLYSQNSPDLADL